MYDQEKLERNQEELQMYIHSIRMDLKFIQDKIKAEDRLKALLRPGFILTSSTGETTISFSDFLQDLYSDALKNCQDYIDLCDRIIIAKKEAYLLNGSEMQLIDFEPELLELLRIKGISVNPDSSNAPEIRNRYYESKIQECQNKSDELMKRIICNAENIDVIMNLIGAKSKMSH